MRNRIKRNLVRQFDPEEQNFDSERRVLIRNHSEYTPNHTDSDFYEVHDADFEKLFGYKVGEKVDIKTHLENLRKLKYEKQRKQELK